MDDSMLYDAQSINDVKKYNRKIKKTVTVFMSEDNHIDNVLNEIHDFDIDIIFEGDTQKMNKISKNNASDIFLFCMKNYSISLTKKIIEIRNKTNSPIVVLSENYDEVLALTVFKFGADEYWYSINDSQKIKNNIFMTFLKQSIDMYVRNDVGQNLNDKQGLENNKEIKYVDVFNNSTKFFVAFTPYEYKTLSILVENAGIVIPRGSLALMVRGRVSKNVDRSVDNIISRIRRKLKMFKILNYPIRSFNSVGYIFVGDRDEFVKDLGNAIDEHIYNKKLDPNEIGE